MNFSKRWITLAPIATVVGLAFKLHDPEGLLGDSSKSDYGITCALIPASQEGVIVGPRHHPGGSPFMNGTVEGKMSSFLLIGLLVVLKMQVKDGVC